MSRILLEVILLAALVVTLYELRRMTRTTEDPPPPRLLDFNLVMERFEKVREGTSRQEVEALLGPPTERNACGPEIAELVKSVERSNRHLTPSMGVWSKWANPKDDGRWVVVFYQANTVHRTFKNGF